MKQGYVDLKYSNNIRCCRRYDSKVVLLLVSIIEGMDMFSAVQRRMKGLSSKTRINYDFLVQMYNKSMGGVDILNQKIVAYRLD